MSDFLYQIFEWQKEMWFRFLERTWPGLLFIGVGIAVLIFLYVIWVAISASQRRQERARCLLALLEIGLKQGRTLEQTILSLAQCRVQELGVWFHLAAAWMEKGLKLDEALEEVAHLVPPQVRAMLRVGREIGDLPRVLPACRATLQDGPSRSQMNLNNLVVLLFVSPLGPAVVWICSIFIFPKFKDIIKDMVPGSTYDFAGLFGLSLATANVTALAWLVMGLGVCLQDAASWLPRWVGPSFTRLGNRLSYWLPWRRRRMQRDFSVMLSLSLESGVPEEKAVRLAAETTANEVFEARAERVVSELRQGMKLTDAVKWLDETGEFRWRLKNATAAGIGGRFREALAGWHEALAAKAFQQEQAVSQGITTGFVFLNGVMVTCLAVAVFRTFIAIMEMI